MKTLELIEVGDEIGMIFPEELLTTLQVGLGDDVFMTPTENGFHLRSNSSDTIFLLQRSQQTRA